MKKQFIIICFALLLFQNSNLNSQQIDTLSNYFSYYDYMVEYLQDEAAQQHVNYYEVDGWKQFMRWSMASENRYDEYGDMTAYAKAVEEYYTSVTDYTPSTLPEWEYIGHEGIYPRQNGNYIAVVGQGNINRIWVDKDDLEHIIAGGNYGSLWETTDGGDIWECISDTEPLMDGHLSIEVNPDNHEIIYVAQGAAGYSNGLFYTTKWRYFMDKY